MPYSFCLFSPLSLCVLAAMAQLVAAFAPRFSLLALGNALLLLTVFTPLATNRLDLGTRVGCYLLLGNLLFCFLLMLRWGRNPTLPHAGTPAIISLIGLIAFGLHVLMF